MYINQSSPYYSFYYIIIKCDILRNAPGGATPLMIASRRGHSRVVELLLQHPDCDAELVDKDGQSAIRHARTDSVKLRIHSLKVKARSVDNVMAPPYW